MSVDFKNLIPLKDVPPVVEEICPPMGRPHIQSVWRWTKGAHGSRLYCVIIARKAYTTRTAIEEFLEHAITTSGESQSKPAAKT